jgi:hypothetical protein
MRHNLAISTIYSDSCQSLFRSQADLAHQTPRAAPSVQNKLAAQEMRTGQLTLIPRLASP